MNETPDTLRQLRFIQNPSAELLEVHAEAWEADIKERDDLRTRIAEFLAKRHELDDSRTWFWDDDCAALAGKEKRPSSLSLDTGIDLWREWFGWSGDPWEGDDYGRVSCFFCGENEPNHSTRCVYQRAKQLVDGVEERKA